MADNRIYSNIQEKLGSLRQELGKQLKRVDELNTEITKCMAVENAFKEELERTTNMLNASPSTLEPEEVLALASHRLHLVNEVYGVPSQQPQYRCQGAELGRCILIDKFHITPPYASSSVGIPPVCYGT